MKAYREQLKKRLAWLGGLSLAYLLANILLIAFVVRGSETFMQGFADGFQLGLALALLGAFVFMLIRYLRAMNSGERLRTLYIAEHDERTLLIQQKAGSVGMQAASFGLAAAAVIAGYFNFTVFLTLVAACLFVSLIRAGMKIYYFHKY